MSNRKKQSNEIPNHFLRWPLCALYYWIQKLCQWDKENHFKFTSLESKFAIDFFNKNPSPILKKDAIISWDSEKGYHAEAEAVFRILSSLKGFFNFFLIFNLLPKSLTNSIYRIITKNRYH